jgi:hypothetical protein
MKENYNTNQNQKSTGVGAQELASNVAHTQKVGNTTPWWFDGVVVIAQLESAFFQEILVPFVNLFSKLEV